LSSGSSLEWANQDDSPLPKIMEHETKLYHAPSETLMLLIRFAKSERHDLSWERVAQELSSIHGRGLTINHVLHYVCAAYQEAVSDTRFGLSLNLLELLLSPVAGIHAVHRFDHRSSATDDLLDRILESHISWILGQLLIAKVSWNKQILASTSTVLAFSPVKSQRSSSL